MKRLIVLGCLVVMPLVAWGQRPKEEVTKEHVCDPNTRLWTARRGEPRHWGACNKPGQVRYEIITTYADGSKTVGVRFVPKK